jgi:1-acyl-sn-glycerol-3-phosphate acyltransferase
LTASPQTAASRVIPQRTIGAVWLLPLRAIYAAYAVSIFLVIALLSLLPLAVLPTLAGRRRFIRRVGRSVLMLMGMPVSVRWYAPLPEPCVVVANHCSYLDGVVLAAILPPRFDFVIKREMNSVPLAGFLLQRIGVQFVTRDNRAGSLRDALRIMRRAAGGSSLAFFPEGTFREQPGLLRFHTGAFAAAQRSGAPVVPLVIRGTRHCLAPGASLPRPGRIRVETLAPIAAPERAEQTAALRDAARTAILVALDETNGAGAEA